MQGLDAKPNKYRRQSCHANAQRFRPPERMVVTMTVIAMIMTMRVIIVMMRRVRRNRSRLGVIGQWLIRGCFLGGHDEHRCYFR